MEEEGIVSGINFLQLNAAKREAVWAHLARLLELGPRKPTVVLLQEQYKKNLPNGVTYSHQTQTKGTRNRAAIFVAKDFADQTGCHLLTDFTDKDQTAISLKIKISDTETIPLIICSTYFQGDVPSNCMIKPNLTRLVDYCNVNKIELLWGCDANAHSTDWGCPESDERGEELADFCIQSNLGLLNVGNEPTFIGNTIDGAKTIIDITLATERIYSLINDWAVSKTHHESDHQAIEFSLSAAKPFPLMSRSKKRTCWKKFLNHLGGLDSLKNLNMNMSPGQLDKAAFRLNEILLTAFEKSSKTIPKHANYRQTWYTDKLDSERAEKNRLQRLAQKYKNSSKAKDKFIEARNKYNANVKKAMREDFRKFTERLDNTKDIARLQKLLESGPSKQISSLEREDGTFTRNIDETISELMKTHFPDCKIKRQDDLNPQILEGRHKSAAEIQQILDCTELHKILWAIRSFSPYKAPGDDDIFPAMLQKAKDQLAPILQVLFRASLILGYIPISWRGALVTFIPKIGKDNYGLPKSYRPISLMSFILKLLEKLIDKKIRNVDLADNPLSPNQHAYRNARSTETALHALISKTERVFQQKGGANLSVFLDIAGAFDNTSTNTIIECARHKGISEWTLEWIESMLGNRSVKSSSEHGSLHIIPTKGCPQGACLSPLLWCLVVDSLLDELHDHFFDVTCFADDVTISILGKHGSKTLYERMNIALKIVENWCAKTGLSVNPDKTQLMMFSKANFDETKENCNAMFYGQKLKTYDSVKYLGITLDRKLTMKNHIDNLAERANKAFWAASIVGNSHWGAKPQVSEYIYKQIVLARICYGCLFFWHKVSADHGRNGRAIKILAKIQRRATIIITGAMRTTPQLMLNAFLGLPPLEEVITQRAIEGFTRLKQNGFWKGDIRDGGHAVIEKIAVEKKLYLKHDLIPDTWPSNLRFEVTSTTESKTENKLTINVDASVINSKTGIALYCNQFNKSVNARASDGININTAEVSAINLAASFIIKENIINRNICIYTDSLEAIRTLSGGVINSSTTLDCINALNRAASLNLSLRVSWIDKISRGFAHDRADKLAKEATTFSAPSVEILPNKTILDELFAKQRQKALETDWNANKARITKVMLDGPGDPRLQNKPKFNRRDTKTLIAMLSGHAPLNQKLFLMKKTTSESCRFCLKAPETPLHFLTNCKHPVMLSARKKYFNSWFLRNDEMKSLSFSSIIAFAKASGIQDLLYKYPP